jgi:phage tail sheath protein FI
MPEYLAPAVYVEEVDTGNKPIEGVSTSTAGIVGVTERGPVNVPILVTSYGEYRRWFGDWLWQALYDDHRFLPHAVEGFFTNGGKRMYVTRVLSAAAAPAERRLAALDATASPPTQLALGGAVGDSTVIAIDGTGLSPGDLVQVGTGVGAEFLTIAAPLAAASVLALDLPLAFNHATGVANSVQQIAALAADATPNDYSSNLAAPVAAGATSIVVATATPPTNPLIPGDLLAIGAAGNEEFAFIAAAPTTTTIQLRAPLQLAHPGGAASTVVRMKKVTGFATATQLTLASAPGAAMTVVQSLTGFTTAADFVQFTDANPARVEIRRIGALTRVTVNQGAYEDYPAGSRVEGVTLPAAGTPFSLVADASQGATVLQVDDRSTLDVGHILQIGGERIEIAGLPAPLPAPNSGAVVLRAGVRQAYIAGTSLSGIGPATATTLATVTATDTAANATDIVATPMAAPAAGDVLRVTTAGGAVYYHQVGSTAALTPQTVTLSQPLTLPQSAGAPLVVRAPMMLVRALDAGVWGDRLQVAMEAQADALLNTRVRQLVSATSFKLQSTAGVETGTELVVTDASLVDTRVKVLGIDRQNDSLITLESTTPLPGTLATSDRVRSREYRFVVELLRQPDPANPLRNIQAIDREVFTNLSLDPRHSRYFQSVIGATWVMSNPAITLDDMGRPLRREDRRSQGDSAYVRVRDEGAGFGLREPPVATYETVPGAPPRLILLPLAHGDDAVVPPFGDPDYIGTDDPDPERRTGLFTLRNIEDVSIIAAPGRTSIPVQAALINQCELMRYRFAVLDGSPPPNDAMADIQAQRQQFDTKYAALYHPWLLIPDPYPVSSGQVPDYPIPPSGHVIGIYARTDIERGVHKAPANEVVRGVIGLQRILNKEQQDILNPYPVNINVIRDFRTNNRGIRVYGGRVITFDSDWMYVNVRRLLIFIEASIDRGLQWVVFEPNAEPLWARVRRAISSFLTLIWRNGALEGTKPEEAYFVKCDRTTMTQTDIDQGRLIVLVGVAPVKPAEFVIVRIGLWTAHADQ